MGHADTIRDNAVLLERAGQLAALGETLTGVIANSRGGTVLIQGEAGIGKTTLLRQFGHDIRGTARVLWTACYPLFTPRPLGPVLDLADQLRQGLAAKISAEPDSFDVAAALRRELRQIAPCVAVIEDAHWADEATLDVVRLLARSSDSIPLLIALSYRDHYPHSVHPLRAVLAELTQAACITARIEVPGLSKAAVAALASHSRADPSQLHERTAGNPFFVTEVLAADTGPIPHSVRQAVLARTAKISSEGREVLAAAAVVPEPTDGQLIAALDPATREGLDECVRAGILTASGNAITFRHEIARVVVEESLPADRRAMLHRRMLSLLEGNEGSHPDLARLAHHAQASGDTNSVLHYAPAAAELAAAAGAHREAAKLFARALQFATDLPSSDRAHLLERFAEEGYFATTGPEATSALREALEIHRSGCDLLGEGRTLRQLARHLARNGEHADGMAAIKAAVDVLERLPPHPELALAYANLSGFHARALHPEAISWSAMAIRLGEQIGCPEAVYNGLNNIGTIEVFQGDLAGVAKLWRSRQLAEHARDSAGVSRAYFHLCWMLTLRRGWGLLDGYLDPAIDHCRDHGQDLWLEQLRSFKREADLARGHWDQAAEAAQAALAGAGPLSARTRCGALLVLARIRARRGQAGCWPLLGEAREIASQDSFADLLPSVAAARAEAAWLERRPDAVLAEATVPLGALHNVDTLAALDLICWRWRAGADIDDPGGLPEPYRMLLTGDRSGASRWWLDHGSPYEAAVALAGSGDIAALRGAADALRRLGARPAVALLARELRSLGDRVVREPRQTTQAHPARLTEREVDVLNLLAAGMRNSEIAASLVVSPRTIDHHVAAILRKLNVRNRAEAMATAARLGYALAPPATWPLGPTRRSLPAWVADDSQPEALVTS